MTHTNNIIDKDPFFEIDDVTRKIVNPASSEIAIVQFDHNSERFTFRLNKDVEGHDMTKCNRIEVHYKNTDAATQAETLGVYEVTDLQVDPEDETKVICTWLISQNATQRVGKLDFLLRFSCVDEDGTIKYAWNTSIFTGIMVSAGLYNSEEILELYADVLEQWRKELFDASAAGVQNINTATAEAIAEVEATGEKVKESIPDDYEEMTEKLKNVTNALKGAASGAAIGLHDISPLEHTMAVKVRSKNLFDKNNYNVGYRVKNTDGTLSSSSTGYSSTDYIPVIAGKTYIVSGYITDDSTTRHIAFYDSNKVFVSGVSATSIFTVPQNACYVRKSLHSDDVETYQIEEGTTATATAYAPYVADVSATKVNKYGANIFDSKLIVDRTAQGITTKVLEDGGISFKGTSTQNLRYATSNGFATTMLIPPGEYTTSKDAVFCLLDKAGNRVNKTNTFTLTEAHTLNDMYFKTTIGETYDTVLYPCLSVGSSAEYEPYKEPVTYTPNADGTVEGVSSLYPSTTLLTDTEGVVIDCEYNRDINKALAELQQAIISLGGNV